MAYLKNKLKCDMILGCSWSKCMLSEMTVGGLTCSDNLEEPRGQTWSSEILSLYYFWVKFR